MTLARPDSPRLPLRPWNPVVAHPPNRHLDAHAALLRLTTPSADPTFSPNATGSMMAHTTALESQLSFGSSYLAWFRGTDVRRTEIACLTWLVQPFAGAVHGLLNIFYQQAGLPTVQAFNLSMAQYASGVVGTINSWFLMSRAGRRTLYLYGSIILLGC
jgi:SP family general alpha glucoside:H+ symporter-like MFS transporter